VPSFWGEQAGAPKEHGAVASWRHWDDYLTGRQVTTAPCTVPLAQVGFSIRKPIREDRSRRGSNGGFSDLAASSAGDVEGAAKTAERQHAHAPGQDQSRAAPVTGRTQPPFTP